MSGDLRASQARAAQAKANYERERTLYEAKVTARADLEAARADYEAAAAQAAGASGAAEAAGVSGRFISVRSPISGRVTAAPALLYRKSVGEGKSVSVRVDLGCRRIIKKKTLESRNTLLYIHQQ